MITAVEERKKGLSALFIDGEYAVSVDTVTLISSGFRAGREITDEELYDLINTSKISRAKEKALYLIEYRPRTRRELEEKLVPLYGEEAAGCAIERLEQLGLINDEDYAREYARSLIERKHYSARRAEFELMKKGIDKSLAEEIVDELSPDPSEQIARLLETKYSRCLDDEKGIQRTINGLKAMGFSWSDIRDVMSDYCDDL